MDTEAKVRDIYKLLDVTTCSTDSAIHQVYPRVYIGNNINEMSAFSLKRYHFRVIRIGDCPKCITFQHEQCRPNLERLLRPYAFENRPVYMEMRDVKIMGIVAVDHENFPISNFFLEAANFIEETLTNSFHKNMLVLSRNGRSRAPTIVVAYLMLKQHMSLAEALKQVGSSRPILPNFGFVVQLLRLEDKLNHRKTKAVTAYHHQNPFPLRTHPTSDIVVDTRPEAKPCCVMHSYKNIPPSFVYKIVDDRERDDSLYTMCAFDRQNF